MRSYEPHRVRSEAATLNLSALCVLGGVLREANGCNDRGCVSVSHCEVFFRVSHCGSASLAYPTRG